MGPEQDLHEASIIALICCGTLGASPTFFAGVLIWVIFLLITLKLVRGSASSDIVGRSVVAVVLPLKRVDLGDCAAAELEASACPPDIPSGLFVLIKPVLVSAEDSIDSAVKTCCHVSTRHGFTGL